MTETNKEALKLAGRAVDILHRMNIWTEPSRMSNSEDKRGKGTAGWRNDAGTFVIAGAEVQEARRKRWG